MYPISNGRWPNLAGGKALLHRVDLDRQRIGDDERERARGDLVLVLAGDLLVGVRQELREAAGRGEGVEVRVFGEDVLHLLVGAGEVVVGIERAAIGFLPAVLTGEANARRLGALRARERIADALHALVVVGRRRAARLDADGAALRLDLHDELGDVDADVIVVRANIGERAVSCPCGSKIRVPGQDRNFGAGRALQSVGHRRRVGGRNRNAVDLLGDEVGHDLGFLVAAAVLAGADIEALHRALELGLGLLAARQRLIEERVVGVLGHERKRIGVGRARRGRYGQKRPRGDGAGQHEFQHMLPPCVTQNPIWVHSRFAPRIFPR